MASGSWAVLAEDLKQFKDDYKLMKMKMHRYPPSIQALGDRYTVPKFVAIGPYYHGRDHLQKAEKMKHVAAVYCVEFYKEVNNNSNLSAKDLYDAVVPVVADINARGLYDRDVLEGIVSVDDFQHMMFYDACFLVIYILRKSGESLDGDLSDLFGSHDNDIALDIMMLENQIPLKVVEAVVNKCTTKPFVSTMKNFITRWHQDGFLQDRKLNPDSAGVVWDDDYQAQHLLGLLRFYAVGKRTRSIEELKQSPKDLKKMESISFSASAIELAKMGIFLTANNTTQLTDMGLDRKWIILAKLSMAPLSLDDTRATWLVNMAALELCTSPDVFEKTAKYEDTAVCSYLLLLHMMMHREEDVHELRTKGILQGSGLNNKMTLDFFTSLHSLPKGQCYAHVMVQMQIYRNRRPWIKVYTFLYDNLKYIVAVVSAIGGFIGIIATLMKLKGAL